MGKLLPVILAVLGLAIGAGAGFVLRPPPPEPEAHDAAADGEHAEAGADAHAEAGGHGAAADGHADGEEPKSDFVKLNNQFVIPVVRDGRVAALVVMSLSVEVPTGGTELVYEREPKLRDAFLQVMFDHANAGGFDGAFTESGNMTLLRKALLEIGRQVLGSKLNDVLIIDIVRQDA